MINLFHPNIFVITRNQTCSHTKKKRIQNAHVKNFRVDHNIYKVHHNISTLYRTLHSPQKERKHVKRLTILDRDSCNLVHLSNSYLFWSSKQSLHWDEGSNEYTLYVAMIICTSNPFDVHFVGRLFIALESYGNESNGEQLHGTATYPTSCRNNKTFKQKHNLKPGCFYQTWQAWILSRLANWKGQMELWSRRQVSILNTVHLYEMITYTQNFLFLFKLSS